MCSFAGIINFKKNLFTYEAYNRLLVRDMVFGLSNTINQFEWVGEHSAFSLACDDIDNQQIIKKTVEGHEFVITCYAKLFNHDEIKNDLKNFGYTFTSESDAEMILYEYIHYGENCCQKLNGVFSFCIWDSMRQQVFICCDKLGTIPFVYQAFNDFVIFATDIKSLFRYPDLTPKIDKNGLLEIFAFYPYKTLGGSVFNDVKELKPATYLIVKRTGIFEKQYSDFSKNTEIINNIDLNARKNVLKPIIAETLELDCFKIPDDYPLTLDKPFKEPSVEISRIILNEILDDKSSPINVFIDRENALKTPSMFYTLILINNWFKEFNPIII